ncbi:hypothetical protein AGMMS50212_16270 [Spirochaetia bacterium]|nr:hypothetical protein AGMMS50212_16240 [Spirochaetia bacterium]GHV84287.1 hypothetical protein AGMMS50212_16270 [Spirochaetia bacterium]
MLDFLYTLIIYPIEQIIELSYGLSFKTFHNDGMAILCISVLVSIVTLPLYFMAEKHQQTERNIQKRLKPKIDKIRAVFHGDEQYMILSSYYRQNNYHPIYALRSSIGLLIQIPFFIAAYSYLSNFAALKGYSFLFIRDLGSPDNLLSFNGFAINILPILMTIINIAGSAVYTKDFPLKEKIQLYGMAVIFLLLLYNSPSGLVLYWTANNVFSLVKNCLQKTKHSKKIVYCVVAVCVLSLDIYLLIIPRSI